jgi:hypothetical protein
MGNNNPYEEGVYPQVPISPPDQPAAPAINPYETLPPGPDTSATVKAAEKPYSAFNTAGRMTTDALFGIPDAINMASRGLNYGINRGIQAVTGLTPPAYKPDAIPYVAPIARKAVGIAELPEDAGWTRALAEGAGSAVLGGVGSAATRGVVRGAAAIPEMASVLNPWRPIKGVTEDALKQSGNNWYNALDNLDVRYSQQTPHHMASAIEDYALKPKGINDINAPQTLNDVNQLRAIDPTINAPPGVVRDYVSPRDIEQVRQSLGTTRAAAPKLPGPRETEAANTAIRGIDNFFDATPRSALHPSNVNDASLVGPVLRNARGDTAAAHRLGYLTGTAEDIGTRLAAKPGASASNEVQALRDRAASALIASREGRGPLYGFNDYEKQLLENVSKVGFLGKVGANAPQSLTGLLMQGGGAGFGASMFGFSPRTQAAIATVIPGTEYAAKKLADWGTRRAYTKAAEAIAARSPLAESLGIAAPPTARATVRPFATRDDLAAALMAPSAIRQPGMLPPLTVEEGQ